VLLLTFLGIAISAGCVYASLRRLWLASDATALDPAVLARALRRAGGTDAGGGQEDDAAQGRERPSLERTALWRRIRAEVRREPRAHWERDLVGAIGAPKSVRVALVNEQLAELDYRAQRWARVPRVCASISSSSGFLLASLAMRAGLASDDMDMEGAVLAAINVVMIGLAGTAVCAAVHVRARAMTRERLAATDSLVDRLEALEELAPEAAVSGGDERGGDCIEPAAPDTSHAALRPGEAR
jgi:hypothetical protein